ncbi:hypothetical protein [Pseudarthrobacter sp. YAF2]|uniref:hypothetical protein n=1 Tax=Pseudarthrobacter sp. YAF2 TaxID=3233078 RepID=UPI003F94617E
MTAESTLILLVRYGWTPTAGAVLPGLAQGRESGAETPERAAVRVMANGCGRGTWCPGRN